MQEGGLLSPSEWNAWTPTPSNDSRVASISVTRSEGIFDEFTMLYPERITGALYGSVRRDTTRYQICPVEMAETDMVDFDPADFSAADFG